MTWRFARSCRRARDARSETEVRFRGRRRAANLRARDARNRAVRSAGLISRGPARRFQNVVLFASRRAMRHPLSVRMKATTSTEISVQNQFVFSFLASVSLAVAEKNF